MKTIQSINADEAWHAIAAVKDALAAENKAAVIAVADAHGELLALLRQDGAPLASVNIATNKAWTAARERKPSRQIGQAARDPKTGFDIAYFGDRRYMGWGGGLPMTAGGAVVGAVAVSGLSEDEDEAFARIGIEAMLSRLAPAK